MQRLFVLAVSIILVLSFVTAFTQKNIDAASVMHDDLIASAKEHISAGQTTLAEKELDNAFESADLAKDADALEQIGDLYLNIDMSLRSKAENAWRRAGYWRSQGY